MAVLLDGDPALLSERVDAGLAAEFVVAGFLDAAEGGHRLIQHRLVVDVADPGLQVPLPSLDSIDYEQRR